MMEKKKIRGNIRLVALFLALVLLFSACSGGSGTVAQGESGGVSAAQMGLFADYMFVPDFLDIPTIQNNIAGTMAYNGRIYYHFVDHPSHDFPEDFDPETFDWSTWEPPTPAMVIASMLPNGSDFQEIRIDFDGGSVEMAGLHIADNGNFRLLMIEREWDPNRGETTNVFLTELDHAGNQTFSMELDVVPPNTQWFGISQALVTAEGYILVSAWLDRGDALLALDPNGNMLFNVEINSVRAIAQGKNGGIFLSGGEMIGDNWVETLRELDLATGNLGDSIVTGLSSINSIHTPGQNMDFDLLLEDGMHLFGFDLATGELSLLLNWIESGIAAQWGRNLSFLDDGRIAVISSDWDDNVEGGWRTEFILLTQTARANLPVREVITIGGTSFWGDIRQRIVDFNRTSQTHRIEIIDYSIYNTPDDWTAGRNRLFAELAIGQGPDILWGDSFDMGTLIDREVFIDLNPFLASDPVLSRSDFFPSVLATLETSDGALRALTQGFGIQTMVGLTEQVGHIENWTMSEMQNLIETANAQGMEFPLGEWMTGDRFVLTALQFSGDQFINWETGAVDLDNDAFIALLEAAVGLPQEMDMNNQEWISEHEHILNNNQILMNHWISGPQGLQEIRATFQDFTVLGLPTPQGGGHLIMARELIGISAASTQQEAAWQFIREGFLPEAPVAGWSLPARIDHFEEVLAEAMVQEYWTDEDGVEHPQSHGGIGWGNFMVMLYALTQEDAVLLREIIDTANLTARWDNTVSDMLTEELLPFLAGDRSAADTARILENRVAIYMSERG